MHLQMVGKKNRSGEDPNEEVRITRAEYRELKKKTKKKVKKKLKGKKKEGGGFWDTIVKFLGEGAKMLPSILPLFLGTQAHRNAKLGGVAASVSANEGWIGSVYDSTVESTAPRFEALANGNLILGRSGSVRALTANGQVRGDQIFRVNIDLSLEPYLANLMFRKYRFRNVAFTFNPNCTTEVAARLIGCFETDVDNLLTPGQGEASVNVAMSLPNSRMINVWTPHSWVHSFHESPFYFAGSCYYEPRLATQGVFTVLAASSLEGLVPDFGDITVSYEVELEEPVLMSSVPRGEFASFYVPSLAGSTTPKVGTNSETPICRYGTDGTSADMVRRFTTDPAAASEEMSQMIMPRVTAETVVYSGAPLVANVLRLPRGYFKVLTYVESIADYPTGPIAIGGCRLLTGTENITQGTVVAASPTTSTTYTTSISWGVYSSGLSESDGFLYAWKLAPGMHALVSSAMEVFCYGGMPPYANPMSSRFLALERQIGKLTQPDVSEAQRKLASKLQMLSRQDHTAEDLSSSSTDLEIIRQFTDKARAPDTHNRKK